MTTVQFANHKSKPNDIMNTYCKLCTVRLASKRSYKKHLFAIHKPDWRQIQQKPKDIEPDTDDPNFYCPVCERKSKSKRDFTTHLMLVHSIYQSAPKKVSLKNDINDLNNNCRACKKDFLI